MTTPRLSREELQHLYQYAMTLCLQPADAQDLLQGSVEVFLTEVSNGKEIKHPKSFVRRVIRNRFIDGYRHSQRWNDESYREESSHDISPVDLEEIQVSRHLFQQVWKELSPQDRDILFHWAILGYTTEEACRLLDVARGTFLSRIHRIRRRYQLQSSHSTPGTGESP